MATFKAIVRYKRADGFYQVYIRVVHRSKMGYIKTDKFITDKQLTKAGEIKDAVVNEFCSRGFSTSSFLENWKMRYVTIFSIYNDFMLQKYYLKPDCLLSNQGRSKITT